MQALSLAAKRLDGIISASDGRPKKQEENKQKLKKIKAHARLLLSPALLLPLLVNDLIHMRPGYQSGCILLQQTKGVFSNCICMRHRCGGIACGWAPPTTWLVAWAPNRAKMSNSRLNGAHPPPHGRCSGPRKGPPCRRNIIQHFGCCGTVPKCESK